MEKMPYTMFCFLCKRLCTSIVLILIIALFLQCKKGPEKKRYPHNVSPWQGLLRKKALKFQDFHGTMTCY